jgi:hypothetical protein
MIIRQTDGLDHVSVVVFWRPCPYAKIERTTEELRLAAAAYAQSSASTQHELEAVQPLAARACLVRGQSSIIFAHQHHHQTPGFACRAIRYPSFSPPDERRLVIPRATAIFYPVNVNHIGARQ